MRSSDLLSALVVSAVGLAAVTCPREAEAEPKATGFDVERLYTSAPGGGWFVMDTLDWRAPLAATGAISLGYEHAPLRVRSNAGDERLTVVEHRASASFGFAATMDRFRLYLGFDMPMVVRGKSGSVGGYAFTGPRFDLGESPDVLSDVRIGFDGRLFGAPDGPFRLGLGTQFFIPSGNRADYVSDHTYRAMLRALVAGDAGHFTYAAHLGFHVRPRDEAAVPGSPQGSELLFGVAAGAKLPLSRRKVTLVIGPELFGATAAREALHGSTTALEALFGARVETSAARGPSYRVKLGLGAGLNPRMGAPEERAVLSFEMFGRVL